MIASSRRRPHPSPSFHLLEVGLSMPLESFLYAKLEGLARRGVQVTVAATAPERGRVAGPPGVALVATPPPGESTVRIVAGVLVAALKVGLRRPSALRATVRAARNPLREPSGNRSRRFAKRLRAYLPLALLHPDIVHFEWNSAAIHYLPMADLWACPTVVSCRGSNINVQPYAPGAHDYVRWLRMSFDRVTAVHCVSDAVATRAAELGMDPGRAWLARPGVDSDRFRPARRRSARAPAASRPLRVVSVGALRWLKAHEYSVRTVALLSRRGVPVTLEIIGSDPARTVGEDSDRDRIELAVARSGLGDRVSVVGELGADVVRERLQAADVLLHSSLTEGLPNSVLEAMACGLPVVVSACGGVAEAVRDGIDGFVVPLRGVTEAADALQALYEDEALRGRMGYAARERVSSGFALERLLDDLMTMYGALCGGVTRSNLPPAVARTAQLRLLSVGPMSWTQGFDDAMHAVSVVRRRGVDCRLRIFGEGPHLDALWFVRRQLDLESHVELRADEPLSRVIKPASPGASDGAASLLACPQWARQLEWADVLLDSALRDPSIAAIDAARAAGVQVLSASGDPEAIAALIATAANPRSAPHRYSERQRMLP